MNTIYKEMLLNTIKHNSLFMLMREDGSTLTVTYNKNSRYPYYIRFESIVKWRSWESMETFLEMRFILLDWDYQFFDTEGVFEL